MQKSQNGAASVREFEATPTEPKVLLQKPTSRGGAETTEPCVVIEPRKGFIRLGLSDIWNYRELLYFLVWRDIKVRYKQTALGAAWALIQPVMSAAVFSVIFGMFAGIPSDGRPYPIFAFAALLPWTYFSQALIRTGGSLLGDANLLQKVYFPRLVVPISATVAPLPDVAVTLLVLVAMMVWFGIAPTWGMVMLPAFLLLAVFTALSVGLWFSALYVRYRDVGYTLPVLTQLWMYASPVVYPVGIVPESLRTLYGLNPMVGVIEGFRWAVLGTNPPDWTILVAGTAVATVLFFGGVVFFKRMEPTFADVI